MKKALFLVFFCFAALPAYAQDDYAYEEDYPEYAEEDYLYDDYGDAEGLALPEEVAPILTNAVPETASNAEPAVTKAEPDPAQKVYIPLFAGTAPYYTINPADPKLPGNHPFLRLKGTLWRNDEVLLSTNNQGVVSARRMYLVFDPARAAVAFASAPYNAPTLSDYPPAEDYINLVPLLETNSYKSSPYQSRYIEIPEKYTRPTLNPMMEANAPPPLVEEKIEAVQPPLPPQEAGEMLDGGLGEFIEEPLGEEIDEEMLDYLEEAYPDEGYSMLPLKYVAQNAAAEVLTHAVVNIGGMDGGIFVHETKGSATPYTVLFLALEKDGALAVYTIQNSFDIRLDTPEIAQARALFKKAFEIRANMKRFRRVDAAESPSAPLLKGFFK